MTNPLLRHILCGSCIIGLLFCSCRKKEEKVNIPQPVPVEIQITDSVTSSVVHTYVGEVQSASSTPLCFPLGGRLTGIETTNNAHVKKGQLLMSVDNTQAMNVLKSAQATLLQAQDGYNRLKQVYEQGGVPEVKWIEMQTQLEKAESMVAGAEKSIEDCTLHAPHEGIVINLDLQTGQQIAPGQRVATLLDISSVTIVFTVPETEIAQTALGDKVCITVPALNDAVYNGCIDEKSLTGNKLSHTYTVKTTLPNTRHELMPGMVCKVHLQKAQQGGYVVPAPCIQTRPEGTCLWIVQNGTARRQRVTAERFVADGVLISSGLTAGDSIVTGGYQKLYHNAPVTIRQ